HVEQPLGFLGGDTGHRDARPHRDDLGDLLLVDRRLVAADLRLPLGPESRDVASASRRRAASSYSWLLIAASFSFVTRSSSFCASRSSGGADAWRSRT